MTNENTYIPLLRFPEFRGNIGWTKKLVKDVCSISTGKSNTQDQVKEGKYPFFIRSQEAVRSNKYLYDCEAVITIGDGRIGQVYHYINGKFDLHQRCYKMSDFQGIIGKFFYYYFSAHFYERAMKMSAKATVDSVRLEMISEMPIFVPFLSEQRKIADSLSSIDDYISSTQEKLRLLQEHKKGLMQQVFPIRGKAVPLLRFPEFYDCGNWELKKLDEIVIVNSGRDYKHLNYGTIPVYGTGGYMLSVDDKLSDCDAVGIGRKGTIDKPQYLKAPFWTVDTLFFLTNKENIDIRFIYYLCQNIPWKKYGEQTGVPSLSKLSIENLEVMVPKNIQEQVQIAHFLFNLDQEINACMEHISTLKIHKQGLMQQLFPCI